jgi:hypothetical protein
MSPDIRAGKARKLRGPLLLAEKEQGGVEFDYEKAVRQRV